MLQESIFYSGAFKSVCRECIDHSWAKVSTQGQDCKSLCLCLHSWRGSSLRIRGRKERKPDSGPLQFSHGLVMYSTVTAVSASMPETEGCAKHCLTPHAWHSHNGLVGKTTWACTGSEVESFKKCDSASVVLQMRSPWLEKMTFCTLDLICEPLDMALMNVCALTDEAELNALQQAEGNRTRYRTHSPNGKKMIFLSWSRTCVTLSSIKTKAEWKVQCAQANSSASWWTPRLIDLMKCNGSYVGMNRDVKYWQKGYTSRYLRIFLITFIN